MAKQLRNWRQAMDDPKSPQCLTFFLKVAGGPTLPGGLPPLYATLKRGFSGRTMAGAIAKLRAGERVRVTDAGQFGDVGVTNILDDAVGYLARASVDELEALPSSTKGSTVALVIPLTLASPEQHVEAKSRL